MAGVGVCLVGVALQTIYKWTRGIETARTPAQGRVDSASAERPWTKLWGHELRLS